MWPFSSTHPRDQSIHASDVPFVEQPVPQDLPSRTTPIEIQQEQDEVTYRYTGYPNERLSIPLILRAPILMGTSFVCGFSLGAARGGPKAGYRYRAENAHRLPTTQTGWFLYQKSKNHHVTIGAMKEGTKFGLVCTGWATLFMVTEEIVDLSRERIFGRRDDEIIGHGQRDAASTVIAAMSMAGIYSWKQGLSKFAAAKTARMALKYSLIYGLVQDAAATVRGNRPGYVDWISRNIGMRKFEDTERY